MSLLPTRRTSPPPPAELTTPGAGWATKKKVVRAQDLPSDYETMPFVQKGYRLGYDSCGCLTSIFEVHNETINIWTHWLGALWFAYLMRVDSSTETLDASTILIFRLICLNLFASSAGYHTFGAISPRAMRLWLRADKLGISLMIAGSYIPGIWLDPGVLQDCLLLVRHRGDGVEVARSQTHRRPRRLGFRCRPRARLVWMAQALILLIVGAMLALECFPKRHSAKAFASLVAIGLLPTADFALHGTAEEIRQFVPKLMLMFFFYGLGFFFFSTKWPESRWPGKFCIVGASHQLWHLCVLAAALAWHSDVRDYLALVELDSPVVRCGKF